MANESLYATKGYLDLIVSGAGLLRSDDVEVLTLSVGGNTAKVGHLLTGTGETYPAVDLCGAGERPSHVLWKPHESFLRTSSTWTIDTAITDGAKVYAIKLSRKIGIVIAMFLAAGAVAHVPGDLVMPTAAGEVLLYDRASAFSAGTPGSPSNAEIIAEADAITDFTKLQGWGTFRDSLTGDGTYNKVTLVAI